MAEISNTLKQKLEHLFGMSGGYVLDFTNPSFADFIQTTLNLDPYSEHDGSKAQILRLLWFELDTDSFVKLTQEMLDRWRTNKLLRNEEVIPAEQALYDDVVQALGEMSKNASASSVDYDFLAKDFGDIDLTQLKVSISYREVIEQRLGEIDRCRSAKAPLAVIFLCGSTLEGLLISIATKQFETFNRAKAAPMYKGTARPLKDWTLESLIVVSRELGLIREDVVKFAHAVKDFRNYIHPAQQVKEGFNPRMFTADIAHQVLLAALADLGQSGEPSPIRSN